MQPLFAWHKMNKILKYFLAKDLLAPLGISLCWLIALAAAAPYGNFPLNDDWAYTKSVEYLLDHNKFFINNWPGMSLFFHVLWGTLFCKVFGFSFLTLRLSIVVMGVIGLFSAYYLFSILSKNKFYVTIAVLLLAFNPFYFSLSLTFMTDVSFTTITILAALFFIQYLKSEKTTSLWIAIFFCIISILIRQIGLLLPLAFVPVLLLKNRFTLKNFMLSLLPLVLTIAALNIYIYWLQKNQSLPPDFGKTSAIIHNLTYNFFSYLIDRLGLIVFYIIAMAIPLSLVGFPGLWRSSSRRLKILTLTAIAFLLFFIHYKFYSIPIENIVYNFGIGPKLLKDTYFGITKLPGLPKDLINFINLIILLFILPFFLKLTTRLVNIQSSLSARSIKMADLAYIAILLFVIIYSIFLIFNNSIFDRYFLPIYPFIIALVIPREKTEASIPMKVFPVIFLITMALFSIAGTSDYFSWNRARWKAVDYLMNEKKVPPSMIDGGFEFNGWYTKAKIRRSLISEYTKSWWFVEDDQYVIAFDELNSYQKIKSIPYSSFLPFNKKSILVLSRNPCSEITTIGCNAESLTKDEKYLISSDSLHYFPYSGTVSTQRKHSGRSSVLLTASAQTWIKVKLKNFEPGEKMVVSFWKYPGKSGTGIVIRSNFKDGFNYFITDDIVARNSSGWVKVKAEINIPSDFGASDMDVGIFNSGSSECWVDDFELSRLKYHKNSPQSLKETGVE